MKFDIERRRLTITPSTPIDEAYIEEVLKLKKDGDYCRLTRKNAMGLTSLAYIETSPRDDSPKAWTPSCLEEAIANSSVVSKEAEFLTKMVRALKDTMQETFSYNAGCKLNELKSEFKKAVQEENWCAVSILAFQISDLTE